MGERFLDETFDTSGLRAAVKSSLTVADTMISTSVTRLDGTLSFSIVGRMPCIWVACKHARGI